MKQYFKNAWSLEEKWRVAAIFGLGFVVLVMGVIDSSVPHSHTQGSIEHKTSHDEHSHEH